MIGYLWKMRVFPLLLVLDQLLKVVIFGGNPDITISDYVGRKYPNTLISMLIDILFWWDKDHCKESYEEDEKLWRL